MIPFFVLLLGLVCIEFPRRDRSGTKKAGALLHPLSVVSCWFTGLNTFLCLYNSAGIVQFRRYNCNIYIGLVVSQIPRRFGGLWRDRATLSKTQFIRL